MRGATHHDLQLRSGKRLREIIRRPGAEHLETRFDTRLPGNDDRDGVVVLPQGHTEQLLAWNVRHEEIDQDDVEDAVVQQIEGLDPTPRRRDVITFRGEHAGAAVAHHALVIDYESANALADRWRDGDEIADGGRRHGRPSESVAGVIVRMCRTHGVAAPATSSCSILDRRHAAQRYNPQFWTQETGSRVVCQDSHGACNDSQVVPDV